MISKVIKCKNLGGNRGDKQNSNWTHSIGGWILLWNSNLSCPKAQLISAFTNACKIIDIAPNFEHKFVFLFSACEMSMMSSSLIDCDKGQYDELVNHPQDTWQYVVAIEIYS